MNKFWMIFVEGSRNCQHQHPTLAAAMQEAERIARQEINVDRKVFILESIRYAIVKPAPVEWTLEELQMGEK